MKRLLVVLLLLSLFTIGAFAETNIQPAAIPVNPVLAGQGGSFTANASGYNSLFKNPAGFAMDGGDFTLLSTNVWGFVDQSMIDFVNNPDGMEGYFDTMADQLSEVDQAAVEEWIANTTEDELIQMLETAGFDPVAYAADPEAYIAGLDLETIAADPQAALSDGTITPEVINLATAVVEDIAGVDILPSGNISVGANVGLLGGVGGGFGFGINLNADATLTGATILSSDGYAALTATGTFGYALELLPDFLYIGADLRPLYRIYVPVSGAEALELATDFSNIATAMNDYGAYAGWGIGVDAGAIMQFGDLKIGVSVTDILGTQMNYSGLTAGELISYLSSFNIPVGSEITNELYVIPMDVQLGAAFRLDFFEGIYLDLSAEISDTIAAAEALFSGSDYDYFSVFNAGAYLSLWDFIGVMGGYGDGYLSAGATIDLLFIEISAAGFMKANPAAVGYSDFGASIEAAIRF